MSLHRSLFLLVVGLTAVVACGQSGQSSTEPTVGEDDITRQKPVAKEEAQTLFDAVDDNCAGNDNGWFTTFAPASFDPNAIMAAMRTDDKDAMGVDCSDQREYSNSRESAVKMFEEHISDRNYDAKACIEGVLDSGKRARLRKLVADTGNLGVFASIYGGGDNPEGCSYWKFDVYRADGVRVEFTFNETD